MKVGKEDGKGYNILGMPKQRGEKRLFYLKAQIFVFLLIRVIYIY